MIQKEIKKALTVMLSFILLSAPCQILWVYGYQTAGSSGTDSLVAQILTFPDQVAVADYWLQQNKSLTPPQSQASNPVQRYKESGVRSTSRLAGADL
jgi:hypothetical protein